MEVSDRRIIIVLFFLLSAFAVGCDSEQAGESPGQEDTFVARKETTVQASPPVTTVNPARDAATPHHKSPFPLSGESYSVRGIRYYILASTAGYVEEGEASWYGRKFHGRVTANGERFDMHALTAAHKVLPFGTRVKVTNLLNGREVIVRINDRGPFYPPERIIDLSYFAAKSLEMIRPGHVPVRVRVWHVQGVNQSAGMALSRKKDFDREAIKRRFRNQRLKRQCKQALIRE